MSEVNFRCNVYDGTEDHWITVAAPNAAIAMQRAIKAVEEEHGTSHWRIWHCVQEKPAS